MAGLYNCMSVNIGSVPLTTMCIFLAQNAGVEPWKTKGVHFGAKLQLGREALSNLLTAMADRLKCVIEICYTCTCKASGLPRAVCNS